MKDEAMIRNMVSRDPENPGSILDLCNLSSTYTELYNDIYINNRKVYTEVIDSLSEKYGNNPYWWTTTISSRNVWLSDCYKNVCLLLLAIRILKKEHNIHEIVVPNEGVKKDLDKYLKKIRTTQLIKCFAKERLNLYDILSKWALYCTDSIKKYNIIRSQLECRKKVEIENLVIEYVYPNCFDKNGHFQSKDFKGMAQLVDEPLTVMPTYVYGNNEQLMGLMHSMVNCNDADFVFREGYLSPIDFIGLSFYPVHSLKFLQSEVYLKDVNISSVINYDLFKYLDIGARARRNYITIRNIKKLGASVKHVIAWYEGQPTTNSEMYALHRFFPECKTIGYEAYPQSNLVIQLAPSREQIKHGAAPDVIAVSGRAYTEYPKEYAGEQVSVVTAPAFRSMGVFEDHRVRNSELTIIFVVLSYDVEQSSNMLRDLFEALLSVKNLNKAEIIIKNHPDHANYRLRDYGIDHNKTRFNYKFSTDDLSVIAGKSSIAIIECATSSSLEVLAQGVPCIIYCGRGQIWYNYLDSEASESTFLVKNATEIYEVLKKVLCTKPNKEYFRNKMLDHYYVEPSKDEIEHLFNV